MGMFELSIYCLNDDDEPELLDVMMTEGKEECLKVAKQLCAKLNERQYFEIFNDETLEVTYIIKDGTIYTSYKKLEAAILNY